MKYFLTADTHFGHAQIIEYCKRPFISIDEMNNILIKNWNQRIKQEDMVFIVGDFCFKSTSENKNNSGFSNISDYKNSTKTLIKSLHQDTY